MSKSMNKKGQQRQKQQRQKQQRQKRDRRKKSPYVDDDEMIDIELWEVKKLTGLQLNVTRSLPTQHGNISLPPNRYVLDDESATEDYVMSNSLTKKEMYESLCVLNHVLRKLEGLGRLLQSAQQ
jgi:hypothetical protein